MPEENYRIYRNIMAIDKAIEEQELQKNQMLCDLEKYEPITYVVVGLTIGFVMATAVFAH